MDSIIVNEEDFTSNITSELRKQTQRALNKIPPSGPV